MVEKCWLEEEQKEEKSYRFRLNQDRKNNDLELFILRCYFLLVTPFFIPNQLIFIFLQHNKQNTQKQNNTNA